jgi:hypothetical protein
MKGSGDITLNRTIKLTILMCAIFIVLAVLKLTIHTDWLWYNVTIPLWCGIPVNWGLFGLFWLLGLVTNSTNKKD